MKVTASKGPDASALHLAWVAFQRRQVSMAPLAGFECVFMPLKQASGGKLSKAWAYIGHFFRTLALLRRRRPATVWVQLPQVPLLWAALVYRLLFAPRAKVVADCHNAMFRPPWSHVPGGLGLLRRCDLVVVHNQEVYRAALESGLPSGITKVLEDVPPYRQLASVDDDPAVMSGRPRPWVLFPGSFAADEPVRELLAAAAVFGRGTVIMTGRTSRAAKNGHDITRLPDNVLMPGFLDIKDFDALMNKCDVVLALTKCDDIQLSVCNEALGFAKPMVVSDTSLLRGMFSSAAIMVNSANPTELAEGIGRAIENSDLLKDSAVQLAEERRRAWTHDQYDSCRRVLDSRS